ncbi:DUF7344 domain-containing protein [Haloterrigena alkaliphila]|uniref:DUF7344 domain-containing protein n=1 Tax=Haloterrigena alkaliphila TaxID=2816475 RepID=UPI003CE4BAD5
MQTQKIDTDELFAIVADSRRRSILRYLRQSGPTTIDSLSDHLSGEPTSDDEAVTPTALHHTHLPRLEAAGLLAYDSTTGRIEPGDLSDRRLTTLLETGAESR